MTHACNAHLGDRSRKEDPKLRTAYITKEVQSQPELHAEILCQEANEMAQWVKALGAKSYKLNSSPNPHGGRENSKVRVQLSESTSLRVTAP